jgi:hypothetical protein
MAAMRIVARWDGEFLVSLARSLVTTGWQERSGADRARGALQRVTTTA